jgi:hypothetical protein
MKNIYQEPVVIEIKVLNIANPSENWYKIVIDKEWSLTPIIDQKELPSIKINDDSKENLFKLIQNIKIPIWKEVNGEDKDSSSFYSFKISCIQYTFECVWTEDDIDESMTPFQDLINYVARMPLPEIATT